MGDILRIAMWSGPRNISTALMRSWDSRPDTVVCDEPFYAYYLQATGIEHPAREAVLRRHETDPDKVIKSLLADLDGPTVFYQKQMAHHLLDGIDRNWLGSVRNCFLIRDPRAMITSFLKVVPEMSLADTGLPQQLEIFEAARKLERRTPPVLDSADVLEDPKGQLGLLCDHLGIEFTDHMLSWDPGLRDTDGVWAEHWYSAVAASTGFKPHKPKREPVPDGYQDLVDQCMEIYQKLRQYRLAN